MRAVGKTEADRPRGTAQALPFVIALVALFVMALMLAGLMGHLGDITVRGGMISGFFVWLGFMATTVVVGQRYQGFGWDLSLIDSGHWLLVALAMGAVIGWMGV